MTHHFRKTKSGQITLLAILLGVLGLTVGLSVASRSLSDLKQASYVDFGTKALAAAEAGAEFGLYQVSLTPAIINCGSPEDLVLNNTLPDLNTDVLNIKSVVEETCFDGNKFIKKDVAQDDVVQANMTSQNQNNNYYVLWQETAKAVEVTVLYSDYSIKRYAYNSGVPSASPWTTDNFVNANGPTGVSNCPAGLDYQSGTLPALNGSSFAIQVRVRPLGGPSTIQICADGPNGVEPQSFIVTSTATTENGVAKKIQVTKDINGTLPSVFDNVIFSGGDLTK